MNRITAFLIAATFAAFSPLSVGCLGAQDLTPEEEWSTKLAIYHSEPVLTQKMPVDAELELAEVPELPVVRSGVNSAPIEGYPQSSPRQLMSSRPGLNTVDADAPVPYATEPIQGTGLPVRLASFKPPEHIHFSAPSRPGAALPVACTGVCVSFSSQGDAAIQALTGKKLTNFQAIEALICADRAVAVPAGRILQIANSIGIETIQSTVGAAITTHIVSLNWRSIIENGLKYGTITALGIMTSGVFGQVSKGALFITALSHEAADDIPKLLSSGAPNPDPLLTNMLNGSGSLSISPSNCQDVLFSGVYSGPNTSFVTDPLQVMP